MKVVKNQRVFNIKSHKYELHMRCMLKMRIKQKAQTATEYLVILAIVVVIALIVIGILGGSIGTGASVSQNINTLGFNTESPIAITSGVVSASGNDSITVRNLGAQPLTITSLNINTVEILPGLSRVLPPGAETTLVSNSTEFTTCAQGDSFSLTIVMNYTMNNNNFQMTYPNPLTGQCAQ